MSPSLHIDATDWRILRELQRSGRITNVELASRVGLSPPPCLRRVQALEKAGIIAGYRAQLDAGKLGFEVAVFALVGLKSQAEAELKAFEAKVAAWPLVREGFAISGEADFLLKLVARDLPGLQDFIIRELTAADNVDSVKTTLILRQSKYEPGVPIA
jgi:DNA-binding Lrp family transcriptional regulator